MKGDINILDDRHEIFNLFKSQCATCRHYRIFEYSCRAFPGGIPEPILQGDKRHDAVMPGQEGDTVYSSK